MGRCDISISVDGYVIGISLLDPVQVRALLAWMKARRDVLMVGTAGQ